MSEAIKKSKQLNIESHKKYFQRNLLSCVIIIVLLIAALYYRRYGKVRGENTELKENVLIERENNVKAQEALNKTNEALLDAREESIIIREQQTKTQEELYRTSAELLKTREEALSLREQKAQAQEELNIYKAEMLAVGQREVEREKEILRLRSLVHWGIKNTLETIKAHLESQSEFERFKFKNMIDEAILKLKEHDFGPLRLELFVEKMHVTAKDHAMMEVAFTHEIDDAKTYEIKGDVHGNLKAIVELAFANIRNHAQCTTASLNFTVNGNELIMEIKDNGIGFKMPPPSGTGINDMRARTAEMGGKCDIVSALGEGTTIKIIVSDPFSFKTNVTL